MQNCSLLKVDKKEFIQISWNGNEECFKKNKQKLELALGNGSLSWKREGPKAAYPLHVRYKPKLVAFNENLSCKNFQTSSNDFAFLHIFFVYPISLEDYRYNIRPIVSDWFARLNEADNTHWIIIFDSSYNKEKKIRSSILEKIRNDFAKYLSRLVEVNDSANSADNEFFSLIQSTLISSFNWYTNALSDAIQNLKNSVKDEGFSPTKLVNLQYKLCQFYWNLGLIENALHELDDLDRFLTDFILKCSPDLVQPNQLPLNQVQQNGWLKRSKFVPFGAECPFLGVAMRQNFVADDCTLTHLRSFILAHQILLTYHMFFQRYTVLVSNDSVALLFGEKLVETEFSRANSTKTSVGEANEINDGNDRNVDENGLDVLEPANDMVLQLRHNFVSFILRYTYDALTHLTEELIYFKANYTPALLNILICVWYTEVFECCKYLANLLEVETASFFICHITYLYCNALHTLMPFFMNSLQNINEFTITRRWFEATVVPDEVQPSSTIFKEFSKTFFDYTANGDENVARGDERLNVLQDFVLTKLFEGIKFFENFGWHRHVEYLNSELIQLLSGHDRRRAFERLTNNLRSHLTGNLKCTKSLLHYVEHLSNNYYDFLKEDSILCFECHLILMLMKSSVTEEETKNFFELISLLNTKILRSNSMWNLPIRFPFQICSTSNTFISCKLNQKICLKITMEIASSFIDGLCDASNNTENSIQIKAILKPFSISLLEPRNPTFCCKTISNDDHQQIRRFACFSAGKLFMDACSANNNIVEEKCAVNGNAIDLRSESECQAILLNAIAINRLHNNIVTIEFSGLADKPGCFALDYLSISLFKNLVFHVDYSIKSTQLFNNVVLFVNIIKPTVSMVMAPKGHFLAGVVQQLCLEFNSGTISMKEKSVLKVSFVHTKALIRFLESDTNEWKNEVEFEIPYLDTEKSHKQAIIFCLDVDRINFPIDQALPLHYDICVNWLEKTWLFPLSFIPIMNFKSATSLLSDKVLFELNVQRCDIYEMLKIVPKEAILLQDQSIAKEPVEARLLNLSSPFEPIVANSSYKFVWQLPPSKISNTIPITHFIKISYEIDVDQIDVEGSENDNNKELNGFMPWKHITSSKYVFENKLTFAVPKVEYEVCAHILSERPQSVLCRKDLQCDLIVTLRSLTSGRAESIVCVVETDPQFWLAVDRFKIVHIKGSGIGQTNFAIIPKQMGFLSYPAIHVHRYVNTDQIDRRSFNETTFIGERLSSFNRNQGKQIHVLGHLHSSDETSSISSSTTVASTSTKKSLKSQAKDKIQKLFELKD